MSVNAENTAHTPATRDTKRTEEPNNGVSLDLIEKRISAN